MTDSQRPQTMEFIYSVEPSRSSTKQPRRTIASLAPEMVGLRYGLWEIVSAQVHTPAPGKIHIRVRCTCGAEVWIDRWNLSKGKSKGCDACNRKRRAHTEQQRIIGGRATSARSRCQNPKDPGYRHYGARGVEFRFPSRKAFIDYVLEHLPHPTYKGVEIDRRNNDGHYEPGNLRLATKHENLQNRRKTRWTTFQGERVTLLNAVDIALQRGICGYTKLQMNRVLREGVAQSVEELEAIWLQRGKNRPPRVMEYQGEPLILAEVIRRVHAQFPLVKVKRVEYLLRKYGPDKAREKLESTTF